MKSSDSSRTLQWCLHLGTLGVLGLVLWYVHDSRELSGHQRLSATQTQNGLALGQVLEEASAYSKRDPSIVPLLNQVMARASGAPTSAVAAPGPASTQPNRR